jgi:hypothetical protein
LRSFKPDWASGFQCSCDREKTWGFVLWFVQTDPNDRFSLTYSKLRLTLLEDR